MAGQFTSPSDLNGHSPYSTDEYFIRSDSIKSAALDDTGGCTAFKASCIKAVIFSFQCFFGFQWFWIEPFACHLNLLFTREGGLFLSGRWDSFEKLRLSLLLSVYMQENKKYSRLWLLFRSYFSSFSINFWLNPVAMFSQSGDKLLMSHGFYREKEKGETDFWYKSQKDS